jgi:uncharacterized protein (DUF433 family)
MQRIEPKPAITHNIPVPKFYPSMFDRTKFQESERSRIETAETEIRLYGSYKRSTQLSSLSDEQVDFTIKFKQRVEQQLSEEQFMKAQFRALADKLCEDHPTISTDKRIFGGMPHIKNVRLSVGDVLAKLYVYGSVQAILDIYSPDISEEQIKEAIAYAQDFLEAACDPRQSPQING